MSGCCLGITSSARFESFCSAFCYLISDQLPPITVMFLQLKRASESASCKRLRSSGTYKTSFRVWAWPTISCKAPRYLEYSWKYDMNPCIKYRVSPVISATVMPAEAAAGRSTWSDPIPAVKASFNFLAALTRSGVKNAGWKGVEISCK